MLLPVVCVVGAAACTLDFDRFAPGSGGASAQDGGGDASNDTSAPDGATGDASQTDSTAKDGPSGNDVAQEAPPSACPPASGGMLVAQHPAGAITVDGDLGDWGAPTFLLLDASDAALITGPSGATCNAANATPKCLVPAGESAEMALLVDATALYVGVRVTVPNVGGTDTTDPYLNDAVEVYLRGDPTATGNYTNVDHQYVVDWQNLVLDYGPSVTDTPQANPPGVTTAVKVGGGGYVLEMKVALSQLGRSSLAPGQTVGFDLGIDHGQGTAASRSFIVWWMATHAPPSCTNAKCTGCSPDQPYCDTLNFGVACSE